jgi:hypothetical protein
LNDLVDPRSIAQVGFEDDDVFHNRVKARKGDAANDIAHFDQMASQVTPYEATNTGD